MEVPAFKIYLHVIRPGQTDVSVIEEIYKTGYFDLWSTYKMSYARWIDLHNGLPLRGYKIVSGYFSRIDI